MPALCDCVCEIRSSALHYFIVEVRFIEMVNHTVFERFVQVLCIISLWRSGSLKWLTILCLRDSFKCLYWVVALARSIKMLELWNCVCV